MVDGRYGLATAVTRLVRWKESTVLGPWSLRWPTRQQHVFFAFAKTIFPSAMCIYPVRWSRESCINECTATKTRTDGSLKARMLFAVAGISRHDQ